MMSKRQIAFVTIVAGTGALLARAALATPSSGVVIAEIMAKAAFVDRVNLRVAIRDDHHGGDTVQVRNAEHTAVQRIVLAPDGQTGWHSHPGPAVALVTAGALTLYSGDDPTCTGRTISAGQAFVDSGQGHVHLARNQTSVPTEVWVTYFDVPPPGIDVRLDAPDPGNCPF